MDGICFTLDKVVIVLRILKILFVKETKMKRRLGRLLMVTGVCASLAVSPIVAFASESESEVIVADSVQEQIQPRVNWSGTAYLAA